MTGKWSNESAHELYEDEYGLRRVWACLEQLGTRLYLYWAVGVGVGAGVGEGW